MITAVLSAVLPIKNTSMKKKTRFFVKISKKSDFQQFF